MEAALSDKFLFNVLVVDDDPTILNLLKEIASMVPGCQVFTAMSPAEAMKDIIQHNIDVVITDIHMPGVTGIEMLNDIIALEKTPEVIVMTAYPSPEIAKQVMDLGAASMIAKPFDDISLVEAELEKTIKKIIRQRSSFKAVAQKKAELAATQVTPPDTDPVMQISLPTQVEQVPDVEKVLASAHPAGHRIIYEPEVLRPLLEIEVERYHRYKRPFALGLIEFPEPEASKSPAEREQIRDEYLKQLQTVVRRSDALIKIDEFSYAMIAFECNRIGAEVLEHKFAAQGFAHFGFAVFPSDASDTTVLMEAAKGALQGKRKFQIVVFEPEEFFGRIIQNMLGDPKFRVTWVKAADDAYTLVNRQAEHIKLFILSLSREAAHWEFLKRSIKENLVMWPILLFTDIPITKELRDKVKAFGVKAVVNKGVSQEDFLYMVQSFVIPKPTNIERKSFRALVTVPIVYYLDNKQYSSNSFTISRDGLFIREMNPPPTGTRVRLEIFIPGLTVPLKTEAEVLYAVPYFVGVNKFHVAGIAVKFIDMSNEDKDKIEDFVNVSRASYLL